MDWRVHSWWDAAVVIVFAVVLGTLVFAAYATTSHLGQTRPQFDADVPVGAKVIYVERDTWRGPRILMLSAGCAVLQEWDPFKAEWHLSRSRAGGFGGTNGLANAWCAAP